MLPTDASEQECMSKCLQMETCTAIVHAPFTASPSIAGECWIGSYESPDPDNRLWLVKDVQYRAPEPIQKFCNDSTFKNSSNGQWMDRFNRTCIDYRRLDLCSSNGVNFTWVANVSNASNSSNWTNLGAFQIPSRTIFYPNYGMAWDFLNGNGTSGESFDAVKGAFGSAADACCGSHP